jgi:hypothetical protein
MVPSRSSPATDADPIETARPASVKAPYKPYSTPTAKLATSAPSGMPMIDRKTSGRSV